MFRLAQVEDVIAVRPSTLSKPYLQAIKETIETRYLDVVCLVANKVWCQQTKMSQMSINHQVIPGVGLVISLYRIIRSDGDYVYPSEGAVQYKVEFELVVFQPLIDEVLHGVIKSCTRYVCTLCVCMLWASLHIPDPAHHAPPSHTQGWFVGVGGLF